MIDFPPPADVFLDTSVVVASIFAGTPHADASRRFSAALATAKSRVYFSVVLRLEFAQALRKLVTKRQLPDTFREQFQLGEWDRNVLVRQRWYAEGARRLDAYFDQFAESFEVPLRPPVWRRSFELMALYGLAAHDAVQVATADQIAVRHFATGDEHFRRVDILTVRLVHDFAE